MRFLIIVGFSMLVVITQGAPECKHKTTCSECIQTPTCVWCARPGNFSDDAGKELSRCVRRQDETIGFWRSQCGLEHLNEPANYFELLLDKDLTKPGVLAGSGIGFGGQESVVQIKPQRVGMKLRVQESYNLDITFRQAEDYPVDLYYLMDLSKSMEDDKASLSKLGQLLADEMQKITKNFRLGFGSFVDKVVMPYVSTVPEKLIAPCAGCAAPYGFKNALPLTMNASEFVIKVDAAPVSGNLDAPEGGFDAIMQAVVCQQEIGWRTEARRLLVFSTDAGFHYAGDGKLGGIVKPNDGLCHLDRGGSYTHSTLLDYPSVSQINNVVRDHSMNVIFAVTVEQSSVYQRLSEIIEGSSYGELSADSSNVVDLVKAEYQKITSKVELKDNATAPIVIKYFSKCLGEKEKETSICRGLKVGDQVQFRAEVTVTKCPEDHAQWHQLISISPVGLSETLLIDLEMLCDCHCERAGEEGFTPFAAQCFGQGTYQCGVCKCESGYFGRSCECGSSTPWGSGTLDDSSCRETNGSLMCSGRGSCTCGECKCVERENTEEAITGKFCECTNFLCERHNGLLCAGPEHGECSCNECKCRPGWTGVNCNCQDSQENCKNPDSEEICSNQGDCVCNQCRCHETEDGRYSGKYCEDCPTCKGKCVLYKDCVQCVVFKSGKLADEYECETNCTLFDPVIVDVAEVNKSDERLCSFFDENDCRFTFVYGYDDKKEPEVRVQRTLECPPKLDILGIVLGVIGAIVAVGLALLLMWKVLTTIHDRREFARFEKERMMARWDTGENPIYKQATSTFKNPLYGGK